MIDRNRQILSILGPCLAVFVLSNGCGALDPPSEFRDSASETDKDAPVIEAIHIPSPCIEIGQPQVFSATVSGGPIDSYWWTFGDDGDADEKEPSHSFAKVGSFDITLHISGPGGTNRLTVPSGVKAIIEGWTRVYPEHHIGDVKDIWQNPSNPDSTHVLGSRGLIRWDGAEWTEVDLDATFPANELNYLTAMGGFFDRSEEHLLVAGRDFATDALRLVHIKWGVLKDGDPNRRLPEYAFSSIAHASLVSSGLGVIAVQTMSGYFELWQYNEEEFDKVSQLTVTGAPPGRIEELTFGGDGHLVLFSNDGVYRTDKPYVADAVLDFQSSPLDTMAGALSAATLVGSDSVRAFVGSSEGELCRCDFSEDKYTCENIPTDLFWSTSYRVKSLSYLGSNETIVGVAIDVARPDGTELFRINDVDQTDPTIELLQRNGLMTHIAVYAIAGFDDHQIWYGSRNGYVGRWNGEEWENTTGILTTAIQNDNPRVLKEGFFVTGTQQGSSRPVIYAQQNVPGLLQPESIVPINVVWAKSLEDIWIVGDFGQTQNAGRYYEEQWHFETVGSKDDANVRDIWGVDSDDIWIVGGTDTRAGIYHYNGKTWTRDVTAEEVFTSRVKHIAGVDADRIYALDERGNLLHYDGSEWTQLVPSMFDYPDAFNECTKTDPSATCKGTVYNIRTHDLSVAKNGYLYAAIGLGELIVVPGDDTRCPVGQFECVIKSQLPTETVQRLLVYDGTNWQMSNAPSYGKDRYTVINSISGDYQGGAFVVVTGETILSGGWYPPIYEVYYVKNGTWTRIDEQPELHERVMHIEGPTAGDFYGWNGGQHLLMRYQTCSVK